VPPNPLRVPPIIQKKAQVITDSAVRHPVFFTERLKKAPNGVRAGNPSWGAVSVGYVFDQGGVGRLETRREGGSRL